MEVLRNSVKDLKVSDSYSIVFFFVSKLNDDVSMQPSPAPHVITAALPHHTSPSLINFLKRRNMACCNFTLRHETPSRSRRTPKTRAVYLLFFF